MVRRLRSQRGIALLAVMLGIALMTLVVMDFTTTAALGYLSAANQANELRAYYLARSSVSVGLALLAQDARTDSMSQNPIDTLQDVWAVPYPPMPVDGGTASLEIVDEARKININQIVVTQSATGADVGQPDQIHVQILGRLFEILGISTDIIPAIIDWIDPDSIESPGGGAEADYYMQLIPPYMPRNGPMPTIGDLKMVRGIDDATFNVLRQFLTVSPEDQVNANTASPQVLAALEPELESDPKLVQEIVTIRASQPFTKVTDVANLPGMGTFASQLTNLLTVRSQFFTVAGMGNYAGSRKIVYSTFYRQLNGTATLAAWQED
jgi:general secretion pathway protein K